MNYNLKSLYMYYCVLSTKCFSPCENSNCLGVRVCTCYVMEMTAVMLLIGMGNNVRENRDFVRLFRKSMSRSKMQRDKASHPVSIFRALGVVT